MERRFQDLLRAGRELLVEEGERPVRGDQREEEARRLTGAPEERAVEDEHDREAAAESGEAAEEKGVRAEADECRSDDDCGDPERGW